MITFSSYFSGVTLLWLNHKLRLIRYIMPQKQQQIAACLNIRLIVRMQLETHLLGWVESLSLLCLELVDSELRLRVLGTGESWVG